MVKLKESYDWKNFKKMKAEMRRISREKQRERQQKPTREMEQTTFGDVK